jgi:LysR family hydrogen peroxide-inducible transcriptional activator
MTLTQLEYLVAVDTHRHFGRAADACFVTQPTLSMQLKKLEETLGVVLFDRGKQPVEPSEAALRILPIAREMLELRRTMMALVRESDADASGVLRMGIIPTLAPYLLPLFLPRFSREYPKVLLEIQERTTEQILEGLRTGTLDAGLMATPLEVRSLDEWPLFYEPFVAYLPGDHKLRRKKTLSMPDLNPNELWLLDEGHCFRNQVLNLCGKHGETSAQGNISLKAGSIETLRALVEQDAGSTLLPELATLQFSPRQRNALRYFRSPEPVREISLVARKGGLDARLNRILGETIIQAVPERYRSGQTGKIIPL